MKNKSVALTDMVKKLGYENSGPLSNQIRDILKSKEDFKKKYVVEEKMAPWAVQKNFWYRKMLKHS